MRQAASSLDTHIDNYLLSGQGISNHVSFCWRRRGGWWLGHGIVLSEDPVAMAELELSYCGCGRLEIICLQVYGVKRKAKENSGTTTYAQHANKGESEGVSSALIVPLCPGSRESLNSLMLGMASWIFCATTDSVSVGDTEILACPSRVWTRSTTDW